jgi:hypothetical protein
MDSLIAQWNSLVSMNLGRVYSLPMDKNMMEPIVYYMQNIFGTLIKLKNQSFYKKKEIETIFLLTKNDITDLNNFLTVIIEDDKESITPLLIYYIIADIFTDLIDLMESVESYEGAKNLLEFNKFWFNLMNIKIPKPNVK